MNTRTGCALMARPYRFQIMMDRLSCLSPPSIKKVTACVCFDCVSFVCVTMMDDVDRLKVSGRCVCFDSCLLCA
jgi:hypothetical protein